MLFFSSLKYGRPHTFFQGRLKFSRGPRGGGQKQKVKKHTISASQGGGGQVPPLAFPCGRPWFEFFLGEA